MSDALTSNSLSSPQNRDPLLAILRGLHDALAQLADTTHWAAERARESLAEVDRLLREQEQADEPDDDGPYPDRRCTGF